METVTLSEIEDGTEEYYRRHRRQRYEFVLAVLGNGVCEGGRNGRDAGQGELIILPFFCFYFRGLKRVAVVSPNVARVWYSTQCNSVGLRFPGMLIRLYGMQVLLK